MSIPRTLCEQIRPQLDLLTYQQLETLEIESLLALGGIEGGGKVFVELIGTMAQLIEEAAAEQGLPIGDVGGETQRMLHLSRE
ncbi:MAG: hypothetical protein M3Q81_04610 [bacterium]|nr:hypothetical protein [bacterium]